MENFESLEYRSREPDLVVGSVTALQTGALTEGIYSVINTSTDDCRLKVGETANDVTAASGRRLFAGNEVYLEVKQGRKIGAISIAGTVTLEIHKVRALS